MGGVLPAPACCWCAFLLPVAEGALRSAMQRGQGFSHWKHACVVKCTCASFFLFDSQRHHQCLNILACTSM